MLYCVYLLKEKKLYLSIFIFEEIQWVSEWVNEEKQMVVGGIEHSANEAKFTGNGKINV